MCTLIFLKAAQSSFTFELFKVHGSVPQEDLRGETPPQYMCGEASLKSGKKRSQRHDPGRRPA
jgi:hypothetical protein